MFFFNLSAKFVFFVGQIYCDLFKFVISTKSLYAWKSEFAKSPLVRLEVADQAAEIRRLKRELARVTEERTILKKATAYLARGSQ